MANPNPAKQLDVDANPDSDHEQDTGAAEKREVGYDCEFIDPPPKAFQTECPLCLHTLRDPQQLICCGYNFCQPCIERVLTEKKPCPMCNGTSLNVFPNKGLQRSLSQLRIRCLYKKAGCEWIGELGQLDQHLHPPPEKVHQGCGFIRVECVHSCGMRLQRRLIQKHQGDDCPKRPYSCDYCREYESTFEKVAYDHYPNCKCYPISCPNTCTPYAIERQNLEYHLQKECPLHVITCEFHYAGCQTKLKRKELQDHLKEASEVHVSLLVAHNQKVVDGFKEENETLKREFAELKKRSKRDKEEVRQELAVSRKKQDETVALLREEIAQLRKKKGDGISKGESDTLRQDVAALKHKQSEVSSKNASLRKELDVSKKKNEQEMKDLKQEITGLKELFDRHEARTSEKAKRNEKKMSSLNEKQEMIQENIENIALLSTILAKPESAQLPRGMRDMIVKLRATLDTIDPQPKPDPLQLKPPFEADIAKLKKHTCIAPVEFVMSHFEEHKRDNLLWHSALFYSHPQGYRLQFGVNASGHAEYYGRYLSVFVQLVAGEFDQILQWPVEITVTVQLVDHSDEQHYYSKEVEIMVAKCPSGPFFIRAPCNAFISRESLEKPSSFVKNNCLHFHINVRHFCT